MSFDIDKIFFERAFECPHDFMCEDSEDPCLCVIDKPRSGFLHIARRTLEECPYMKTMGDGLICTCPVRVEIYRVYHK